VYGHHRMYRCRLPDNVGLRWLKNAIDLSPVSARTRIGCLCRNSSASTATKRTCKDYGRLLGKLIRFAVSADSGVR
jgi:hypothetical protein